METKEALQKMMVASVGLVENTSRIPVLQAEFQLALAQRKFKKAKSFIQQMNDISIQQGKWAKEMFALQHDLLDEMP